MTDTEYLRALFFEIVQPPFEGDIVEWADGNLKIPYSVRYPIYIAAESPWLIEPLRALSDPMVRRVDVRMPAGAAKSLIGEIQIAHCLAEDPGMYYYVWQTDDDAKDAMEDRIYPMIEANQFLAKKMPVDRNKKRGSKIAAPHMSLYAVGANLSAAQSKRVKFLTMEEPHLYGPGMMTAFEKRVEAVKDPIILTLSTGSVIDDESDDSFNAGSCEVWQVPCKFCGQFQTMTDHRDRLRAQIDKDTCDDEGNHIWSKILPTVRYNCEHCDKDWPTDEASRKDQSILGRFIQTNENAPGDHRSFHLEAVSVHYFDLANLVMEKIKATIAARRGAMEPLKDYIQKRRAMAWDDEPVDTDQDAAFDRSKGNYNKGDPFEGEIARFLDIDNQAGKASKGEGAHRWYVCRAFGPNECRLIDEGKIDSWEEMEEKRIELGVEPARTMVDIAFDTAAVQAVCVRYGWQGLWGDNTKKRSFPHHEMVLVQNKPTRITRNFPFSSVNIGHVGIGKQGVRRQARYFFWCQNPIKDMWHRLKNGLSTYRWTVPQDVSEDYRKQIQAEYKVTTIEKKTGRKIRTYKHKTDNHMTDCDQMALVSSLMDTRIREILWSVTDESENGEEKPK
jgi:hypothetical protein